MGDDFYDKIVLVTGAGSGIGRAAAEAFAAQCAQVVVADLNELAAAATCERIHLGGGRAIARRIDVASVAAVDELIGSVVSAFGRLDIAINNAGMINAPLLLADVEEADFDRGIAVNLKGVWACMRAEVRAMLKTGRGVIINTASTSGLIGSRYSTTYTAAKHGVIGLTKAAALDYAGDNIRINAVCPGAIETAMTRDVLEDERRRKAVISRFPVGRLGTPEEIASAMLWLACDGAAFTTGASLVIDGGLTAQ